MFCFTRIVLRQRERENAGSEGPVFLSLCLLTGKKRARESVCRKKKESAVKVEKKNKIRIRVASDFHLFFNRSPTLQR